MKSYDYKRLKKYVLSLLRKLVRDEISLMSEGSAFQVRGAVIENALSVTIHEAGYVSRRQSCRTHWTEAGCRHSINFSR